jgi:transcriptional regulator with XRE-family HTH domain
MTETRDASPVRLRRRLRHRLRDLRTSRNLTQADAAAAVHWSESKVVRIEGGIVGISPDDLQTLLRLYQVTDEKIMNELTSWAEQARRQPWSRFRDVHSDAFRRYLGYESDADWLREFESQFVPGLLQTEDYARALLADGDVSKVGPYVVSRIVEARLQRQRIFETAHCPSIEIILDEVVIRRPIGGPMIMAGQLENLLRRAQHPRVTLRILPFDAGTYAGIGTSFVILGFDDDGDRVLYREGQSSETTTTLSTREQDPLTAWVQAFDEIQRLAATPETSQSMIQASLAHLNQAAGATP